MNPNPNPVTIVPLDAWYAAHGAPMLGAANSQIVSDQIIGSVIAFLVVGGLCLALYFMPTIIAVDRHHRQRMAIGALNFFLGWSGLGWVGALVWALTSDVEPNATPRNG